ncbi:hypothetical protein GLOIN_2v1790897 [Rhizophagus irregularis DAOM 181602=DAOM 197198]|nr:hypothetical protein GLOIN_2v1790897 [Rhizophagus irregularis DAOM 181602=DAOM 197198]
MSLVPLYWIVSQNSGKVLDVIDGSTQVNSRVVQYHKKSSEMSTDPGSDLNNATVIQINKKDGHRWVYDDINNHITLIDTNFAFDLRANSSDENVLVLYAKNSELW